MEDSESNPKSSTTPESTINEKEKFIETHEKLTTAKNLASSYEQRIQAYQTELARPVDKSNPRWKTRQTDTRSRLTYTRKKLAAAQKNLSNIRISLSKDFDRRTAARNEVESAARTGDHDEVKRALWNNIRSPIARELFSEYSPDSGRIVNEYGKIRKSKYRDTSVRIKRLKNEFLELMSPRDFEAKVRRDRKRLTLSQKNSAGLRSSGNAKIQSGKSNFDKGFTSESKSLGYKTTGSAETKRQKDAIEIVSTNTPPVKSKNTGTGTTNDPTVKSKNTGTGTTNDPPVKSKNTGTGTTNDPYKATQPNMELVSPLIESQKAKDKVKTFDNVIPNFKTIPTGSYVGISKDGQPVEGAVKPEYYVVIDSKGKERKFKTEKSAEKFIERTSKEETVITPLGLTSFVKENQPTAKILDTKKHDNIGDALISDLSNAIRYADAVDSGEVDKSKLNLAEQALYYSSSALKPITDLAYAADEVIRGTDHKVQPSISSTLIDAGIDVGSKIIETGDLTPEIENKVADYVKEDPLRTVVQLPAEAALWIAGGKAIQGAVKVAKAASPVKVIAPAIEEKVVYRGVATYKGKPLIGIAENKIHVGAPKIEIPELSKPALQSRNGGELALGRGGERALFYSEETLSKQVSTGYINPLSKERADAWIKLTDTVTKSKGVTNVSKLGDAPFKGQSAKQGQYVLEYAEKLNKSGDLDTLHGSIATRAGIDDTLRAEAGNVLRMGDIDFSLKLTKSESKNLPKLTPGEIKNKISKTDKALERKAISKQKEFAKNYPLESNEKLVLDEFGKNKGIYLIRESVDESTGKVVKHDQKIAEFVLEKSKGQAQLGKNPKDLTHILDKKIPDDNVKLVEYDLEARTLNYQFLTQAKTGLSYQKYLPTATGKKINLKGKTPDEVLALQKLDTKAKAMIHPAEGRSKDIVRGYWEARQISLNQLKSGQSKLSKETRTAAENLKSKYPELDFSRIPDEKVLINFSTKSTKEAGPSGISKILETTTKVQSGSQLQLLKTNPKNEPFSTKPSSKSPTKSASVSLTGKSTKLPSTKSTKSASTKSTKSSSPKSTKLPSTSVKLPSTSVKLPSTSVKLPSTSVKTPSVRGSGSSITILPSKRRGIFLTDGGAKTPKRRKERNSGKIFEFIGNSRSDNVSGIFNRREITYGKKSIKKILHDDESFIRKSNRKSQGKSTKKSRKKSTKKSKSLLDIEINF
ncbi:MAG: hypothetical protein IS860_10835 [Nitrosopumilus sp.]|nr:hypothetical protein [Nitrosopumilus sp.]